jgi:hypothetical protein
METSQDGYGTDLSPTRFPLDFSGFKSKKRHGIAL